METKLNRFEKLMISARYWLLGMAENDPQYFKVLDAMEFAAEHHNGKRNGGDHEFIHQLGIFHNLRTLHKHIKNPVTVYILAFLHDIVEDPNKATGKYVTPADIFQIWGEEIAAKVLKLSKEIIGQKNLDYSLSTIFDDEDCGLVKAADRIDNVSSMFGVFKPARLQRYIVETVDEFMPRIKMARRMFPHQEAAYENFKLSLVNQLKLLQHLSERENAELSTPTAP